MRDLVLLGLLPLFLYAACKRPFIALGIWIWTAMFFPNAWVFGPAASIRYNLIFTVIAVAGYFFMKEKNPVRLGATGSLVILFFLWTTLSTAFTVGSPEIAWEFWSRLFKVVVLFIFIILIMQKKLHIDFFLWCLVLSIGFYAGLEGLKFIASGGTHRIAGFYGHVLGDRNDLALALVMMVPICLYLLTEYGKASMAAKVILLATLLFIVLSVIGTQSRGGAIALAAVTAYLILKNKKKFPLLIAMLILTALCLTLLPEEWWQRMETIANANEDDSFMGRVVAWKLSLILALDHPLTGGGFKALEYFPVWLDLAQRFDSIRLFFPGEVVPDLAMAHAAHSIYFQVLGDHGFVGLALYLGVLLSAFQGAGSVARRAQREGKEGWIVRLAQMLQLTIFSFCFAGTALSLAYFEFAFAIFGLVVVLDKQIAPQQPPVSFKPQATFIT